MPPRETAPSVLCEDASSVENAVFTRFFTYDDAYEVSLIMVAVTVMLLPFGCFLNTNRIINAIFFVFAVDGSYTASILVVVGVLPCAISLVHVLVVWRNVVTNVFFSASAAVCVLGNANAVLIAFFSARFANLIAQS